MNNDRKSTLSRGVPTSDASLVSLRLKLKRLPKLLFGISKKILASCTPTEANAL